MSVQITGLNETIRHLNRYRDSLKSKAEELRRRVAELIQAKAQPLFDVAIADSEIEYIEGIGMTFDDFKTSDVSVTVNDNGEVTLVVANGDDAVFMEFGAGVYFNGPEGSSPNPWGADLGFTIGSYGHHLGSREVWGYIGADGERHLTHGTPASMPMYRATMEVVQDIANIAREVFRRDQH